MSTQKMISVLPRSLFNWGLVISVATGLSPVLSPTAHCIAAEDQPEPPAITCAESPGRLQFALRGQAIAEYVYADSEIWRPYFCHVRTPSGREVTRHHPPRQGVDADDHATMHPGIWLAFGDINGQDFWRNKARIEHVRFTQPPTPAANQLSYATESRLLSEQGSALCQLINHFKLQSCPGGWQLAWTATFQTGSQAIVFGDQEEMGFAARMATPLTEKNGGLIVNSQGLKTAGKTWGQPADWCDYSGQLADHALGLTLVPAPLNFRSSWWHNRDYGVFVANPFGRKAMRQGEQSAITVAPHQEFRLGCWAVIHEGADYDPAATYDRIMREHSPIADPAQPGNAPQANSR